MQTLIKLEMENLENWTNLSEISCTNRVLKKRFFSIIDCKAEEMYVSVKESVKSKNAQAKNIQEIKTGARPGDHSRWADDPSK